MQDVGVKGIPVDYADALRVHGEAADSLIAGNIEGYTAHLSAESQKWFAEMISTKGRLTVQIDNARFKRHPTYILGGPSLKVLLFAKGDTDMGSSRELVVTPSGGKAQIVNLGSSASFEGLLEWAEFGQLFMDQYFDAPVQGASTKP